MAATPTAPTAGVPAPPLLEAVDVLLDAAPPLVLLLLLALLLLLLLPHPARTVKTTTATSATLTRTRTRAEWSDILTLSSPR